MSSHCSNAATTCEHGSGDRSQKIRTYNFPQNRLTDHRVNLTLYSLDRILEGELADLVYVLLVFFVSLLLGARVFAGKAFGPAGPMWSYALVTMLIILGSTVTDSPTGDAAGAKSFTRFVMFLIATV